MGRSVSKMKLGLNGSSRPKDNLKGDGTREADIKRTPYRHEDWQGTVKGKTTHTYKSE